MTRVLFAVSGSDHWTLADGTRHPCGFWPEELAVPHEVFAAAGFDITIATPGGVTPTADEAGFSAAMNGGSEEPGARFRAYLESIRRELDSPARLENVEVAEHDFVFVPGGHGPMEDLAASPAFGALVSAFADAGSPVAAVCHGPAALLPARDGAGGWRFAGRRVTGFTNDEETQVGFADRAPWLLEDRLRAAGGAFEHSDAAWAPLVVVDDGLYTGQNPASSRPLAEELVRALTGAETSAAAGRGAHASQPSS
jgi:putative intracellular protease/amidase